MSTTFQADLHQNQNGSKSVIEIEDGDLKKFVLKHTEANSGVTFEGNSNISVENSKEVVIGTLTQFMGPVTIMQQNSLKRPLTKDNNEDIPSISKYVPQSFVNPPQNTITTQFCKRYKRYIIITVVISIPIILIILGVTLSIKSYHELKEMESSTQEGEKLVNTTQSDILFRNTVNYVMISHSVGRFCKNTDACEFTVQYHQNFHSHSLKYGNPNFGRNFFIGGDGKFYLDRGWNVKNNVSDNNIEICFMGDFNRDNLTKNMVDCAKGLITFGIKLGIIAVDYILVAHNQTYNNSDSPGKNAYAEIKTWPHWKDGVFTDA